MFSKHEYQPQYQFSQCHILRADIANSPKSIASAQPEIYLVPKIIDLDPMCITDLFQSKSVAYIFSPKIKLFPKTF